MQQRKLNQMERPSQVKSVVAGQQSQSSPARAQDELEDSMKRLRERQADIIRRRQRQAKSSSGPSKALQQSQQPSQQALAVKQSSSTRSALDFLMCGTSTATSFDEVDIDDGDDITAPGATFNSDDSRTYADDYTAASGYTSRTYADDYTAASGYTSRTYADDYTTASGYTYGEDESVRFDSGLFNRIDKFLLNPLGRGKLFSLQEKEELDPDLSRTASHASGASDDEDTILSSPQREEMNRLTQKEDPVVDPLVLPPNVRTFQRIKAAHADDDAAEVELTLHRVTRIEL